MNGYDFVLAGAELTAMPSGALWWRGEGLLVVSDLHLGKSERMARRGGPLLPPYEGIETLGRLDADIARTGARRVICLGDSFDDLVSAELPDDLGAWLARMMAGRHWVWIEGNHDPGPVALGGEHRAEMRLGPLVFRHIAATQTSAEVSGHYHPKAGVAGETRRCFLLDERRLVLPAYGAFTGGLSCRDPVLRALMGSQAKAILTGARALAVPLPR